jgi:uncharacterized ferredoxin-like protein
MGQRRLEAFDTVFQRATEHALRVAERTERKGEALLLIPCKSQGEAINLQMQFRQYWKALEAAFERGDLSDIDPRFRIAAKAATLAARTSKKGKNIAEIVHRGQLTSAMAVASALGALNEVLAEGEPETAPRGTSPSRPEEAGELDGVLTAAYGGGRGGGRG